MTDIANELLETFANAANEAAHANEPRLQAKGLRWQIANDRYPPAVVIMRRGKDRKAIATISPTSPFASLYPSWQPVIKDWICKRIANGGKKTNHEEIANGEMP